MSADDLAKLNDRFVHVYVQLFDMALRTGFDSHAPAVSRAPGQPRGRGATSSSAKQDIGSASRGKKYSASTRGPIADGAAFIFKTKVDKRVRAITRDIAAFLDGKIQVSGEARRCTRTATPHQRGCGLFVDDTALYCPRCGAPTREADET